MWKRHLLLVPLVLALLCAASAAGAGGGSPSLVVSQLYASGGNSGAVLANDYVELFNRSTSSVDLSGWTRAVRVGRVDVVVADCPVRNDRTRSRVPRLACLRRRERLVLAGGRRDGDDEPRRERREGRDRRRHDRPHVRRELRDHAPGVAAIADFVGYGAAADYEGADAAPAPSATSALVRAGGGCIDTNANDADFSADTPAPRNSSSARFDLLRWRWRRVVADRQRVRARPGGRRCSRCRSAARRSTSAASPPDANVTPVAESVTVTSNDTAGYNLTVHRSAFTPARPAARAVSDGAGRRRARRRRVVDVR